VLVSVATWYFACRFPISAHRLVWVACLIALVPVTWFAQFLIGNILYKISNPAITSVGFWGGPPVLIAPAIAGVVALASSRRRRSGDATSNEEKPSVGASTRER
jgi:hypothetical protein